MLNFLRSILIALTAVASIHASAAGFSSSSSQPGEEVHFKAEQVIAFAKKVEKTL